MFSAVNLLNIHIENILFTFPSPGVSLILLAARRRQGGAGGGATKRAALKLVGNRGGSHDGDGDDVSGAVTAADFCFFFFDAKFNFCAALSERSRKEKEAINQSSCAKPITAKHFRGEDRGGMMPRVHGHMALIRSLNFTKVQP